MKKTLVYLCFCLCILLANAKAQTDKVDLSFKKAQALPFPFSDGFENGLSNWIVSGQDWDTTSAAFRSGGHCVTDSRVGNYPPNSNASLTLKGTIDLSGSTFAVLTFWHKYSTEGGYDKCYVEISTDGGLNWSQLKYYSGSQNSWVFEQLELWRYKTASVQIRFRLSSDGSISYDGWYIDDVEIKNTLGVAVFSPNGGEDWLVGTTQNIRWESNVSNVKLEYSTDNGTSWRTIIASIPGALGSYNWVIPNTPSYQCKVKISDASNASVSDVSDGVFTISSGTSLSYGSMAVGSIGYAGEMDSYTFNTSANDVVTVRIGKASGSLYPQIEIYSPGGTLLKRVYGSSSAKIDTIKIPTSGVCTILAMDGYGTYTGAYGLSLQLVSTPGSGQLISYGTTKQGNINLAGQMDSYTFNASANDVVTVRIGKASGSLYPKIEIYSPGGTLLKRAYGSSSAYIDTIKIPTSGVCTILAMDEYGTYTGAYGLSLQLVSAPGSGQLISYGATKQGNISLAGQTDSYTFNASASDVVTVQMGKASGSLYPQIEIYSPGGTLLKRAYGSSSIKIDTIRIPTSGVCTILAMDGYGTYTGTYGLSLIGIVAQSSITLISPNGGENWLVGSTQNITWTSSNITNVKIEYTTNNGTSWSTIIASTPATTSTYSWTIPNTPSTQCKVKISDASNATVNDVSDNLFTISTAPTIVVTKPNGGENWLVGSTQNITWTSNGVTNVKIEYTINNGTSWLSVVSSTPASTGSYSWIVPNTPSTNCKVRISDVSNTLTNDMSDNVFTISSVQYTVLTSSFPPAGGSTSGGGTYNSGQSVTVTTIPNSGYTFNNWTEIGAIVSTSVSYTFTISSNRTLVANFSALSGITITTNPTGRSFTVDGTTYSSAQTFQWTPGSNHTISTTSPQSGGTGAQYVYSSWSDGGAMSHTITAPSTATTYIANFTTQYYLTMTAGTGGTVSPASGWYNSGQSVSINATANSNYVFSSWSGSGSGSYSGTTKNTTVTMNGPITQTANFAQNCIVTLSSNPSNGGTTSGWGTYYSGSSVTVTATPNSGYLFTNWTESGTVVSTSSSYTFTVSSNRTLVANFTTSGITITTNPTGRSFIVDGTTYTSATTFQWTAGSSHTISTTSPQSGGTGTQYVFSSWSNGGAQSHTITAPSTATTYTANFTTQYYLTMSAGTGGTVSPASGWYNSGQSVSINATANSNYIFSSWSGSGSGSYSGTTKNTTVTMNGPITQTANFSLVQYTVSASANPSAGGTTTGAGTYNSGSSVTVTATAASAYQFINWTEYGTLVSTSSSYTFTISSNRTFVANFMINQINISQSYSFTNTTSQTSYKLIGLPGENNFPLSDIMTGTLDNDWVAYRDNGQASNYYEKYNGSSNFYIKPGIGFWVLSKNTINVNRTVPSVNVNSNGQYGITLQSGWKIISNPFSTAVNWSNVTSKNSVGSDVPWDYTAGTFAVSQTLEPYKGYYFKNTNGLAILYVPYPTLGKISEETELQTHNDLTISLNRENKNISEVKIGFNKESKVDYDRYDIYKPVSDFEMERIVIYNPELSSAYKYLYRDMRSSEFDEEKYDLKLKVVPNKQYRLNFLKTEEQKDKYIYLRDKKINVLYNVGEEDQINFSSSTSAKEYELIISKNKIEEVSLLNALLTTNKLYQNYPNPFNPSTIIRFALPQESIITIKAYNILGELIRTIVENVKYNAGYYEVEFNGNGLASGVYFVQMITGGKERSIKIILSK